MKEIISLTLQRMISLIQSRIHRNTFDDVMEVAWATMWNVTDETPINCERFLNLDGMKHFISCLRVSNKDCGNSLDRFLCILFTEISREAGTSPEHVRSTGKCGRGS